MLGYPALTLMNTLRDTSSIHALRGSYTTARAQADEIVALADEKGASPGRFPAFLSKVGFLP